MIPRAGNSRVFISDFDGTMTAGDFCDVVIERLLPPDTPDFIAGYLAGRITHFEAMRGIMGHVRGDEAALHDALGRVEIETGLAAAITRLQRNGWPLVIVSAGCDWYIHRLLAARGIQVLPAWHGIEMEIARLRPDAPPAALLYTNPGEWTPGRGIVMRMPSDSPYYSPEAGINKAGLVAAALEHFDEVGFAGNGRLDLDAALGVPPERRFARGRLAEELAARAEPFQPFTRWSDIAERLMHSIHRAAE